MSCSTRLRRIEMIAISLPEKKPLASKHKTIAARRRMGVVTARKVSSWIAGDLSRSFGGLGAGLRRPLSPLAVFDSVGVLGSGSDTPGGKALSNGEFDVTVIGSGPGGYVAAIR